MSLRVVIMVCKEFLVGANGFLVLRFRLFPPAQRLETQRELKMCFSEIRVKSNSFHKRQHCLGVLVLPVEFLPIFELFACSRAFPGQIVGHLRHSGTTIRALLTTAPATNGKYQ